LDAADVLTWTQENRFTLGGTTFQTTPKDPFGEGAQLEDGEFFIFKERAAVERYAALIAELEPQNIFELGIYHGGSTLFFAELAGPRRVVAIDRLALSRNRSRIESHARARGLGDVIRIYVEVEQEDRAKLAEIVDESFGGSALDLVVDDCSHLYEPTRASFNELFPRLRRGGVYVIEDWRWAHREIGSDSSAGLIADHVPLTRLLFEIVLAIPAVPGLIADVSVDADAALITRGEARVDPATFDLSECANATGGGLLSPP
jgi:SAM-dependent methyltransferase